MGALSPDKWNPEQEPARVDADTVTLVEGSSFCICTTAGDLVGSAPMGVFFRDTRILSRLDLRVDGEVPDPLTVMISDGYRGTFLGRRSRPFGRTDTNLLVHRERRIGNGLREDVALRNPGPEPASCVVTVSVEADFADLFEVKEGRVQPRGVRRAQVQDNRLHLELQWRDTRRGAVVEAPSGTASASPDPASGAGSIRFDALVPARGEWSASMLVRPVVDGEEVEPSFPLDRAERESLPAQRLQHWRETTPIATAGDERLRRTLRRSQQDVGSLRIFDPEDPTLAAVAAGAPWFMALFGRDSLLTAYMSLPVDRTLALGTLRTLARHQGRASDPLTEEEPGRILHEVRLGVDAALSLGGGNVYYGTVDATPLFVVLLGEFARWGGERHQVEELLPHADRALEWMERYGDRDADGFIEYRRATDRGLQNQGWKDSWDGITFADGRPAEAPIALCEVQGYAYGAFRARAELADWLGDEAGARRWSASAATLKAAFNDRFWLPERGWYALALDREKTPVDACASNMGHCLWSGIVDAERAPLVAEHLLSPEMFTGWGVRTLGSTMGAFDPVSYHNGSVWPHDNAVIVAGLMRYGFVEEAQRVAEGVLTAAEHFGGRLPELFCGFDRAEFPEPVPYPTSCSPQAWASATPLQLVRTLLRFDPDLPRRRLWVAPVLPASFGFLRVEGVGVGDRRVDVETTADGTLVENPPSDVELRDEPRPLQDG